MSPSTTRCGSSRATFSEEAILKIVMLQGFYRTVSALTNVMQLAPEAIAPRSRDASRLVDPAQATTLLLPACRYVQTGSGWSRQWQSFGAGSFADWREGCTSVTMLRHCTDSDSLIRQKHDGFVA
jgi:hypothetical protein